MRKIILHLCADIGSDSKPYQDAGYDVICIGKDLGVENYRPPKNVYGIIANPPCTEFSRARSGGKARNVGAGMVLVKECQRIIEEAKPKFWVIENPATGALRTVLGVPRYSYQPWWFGSPWTKKTSLWGNFNIPKRKYFEWEEVPKLNELYQRPGRGKPALVSMCKSYQRFIREWDCFKVDDNASFRSLCSQKFAKAFFEVNK